jgi:hypothetical protein
VSDAIARVEMRETLLVRREREIRRSMVVNLDGFDGRTLFNV